LGSTGLRLLIVSNDSETLLMSRTAFPESDLEIYTASNTAEAWDVFFRSQPQVVLLETDSVAIQSNELLKRFLASDPGIDVILVAKQYSANAAVEAIRLGATDYFSKPVDIEKLQSKLRGIVADAARRKEALTLDRELIENYTFEGIIGRSLGILDVFSRIRRVAPHFRVLLIHGDTGTGKELVARAIHNRSPGAKKPFVACNCSAFVDTLLETELFGYVKGAFTGADRDRIGLFEYATGGTVFLDEIGDMPLGAQAKLLRVLQNQEIQRVGSPKVHTVDTRVIAATNRDLQRMASQGKFREDLYYRLAIVEVALPPLAQRKEDLPLLLRHFIEKYSTLYKKNILGMTRRAQARLFAYSWPGNVRELENVVANACMMTEGNSIDVKDLRESILNGPVLEITDTVVPLTMERMQEKHLLRTLAYTSGNKARAAEILDISRETIYSMLERMAGRSAAESSDDKEIVMRERRFNVPGLEKVKRKL
jgi:DNA-binding NtrC family response regulator